jgi:hypothetical protein
MEDAQAAPPAPSRDDWKRFSDIRVHPNTAAALQAEAVIQSAAMGRPVFPRHVAAHVLNEWSKERTREMAARRYAVRVQAQAPATTQGGEN